MRSNDVKYSIVIPTYKHLDDCLKPCLESIIKTTDLSNVEVIVVANGCGDDGTKEFVESLGDNFVLIWFDEPLGYTKSTNIGINASVGEYVILLNNDCILLDNQHENQWINFLETPFLNNEKMAITGVCEQFFLCFYIEFFCVMIPRKIFKELGLLDEIFSPGNCEDVDFCIKAKLAGYLFTTVADKWFPIYHPTFSEFDDKSFIERNKEILIDRYKNMVKIS